MNTETNHQNLPLAVCLLALNEHGNVLTVSRRHTPSRIGLPGGKVDPGETLVESILREAKEETNQEFTAEEIEEVYAGVCEGEQDYWCVTFRVKHLLETFPTFKNSENCWVSWVAPYDVLQSSQFSDYNEKVFDICGIRTDFV